MKASDIAYTEDNFLELTEEVDDLRRFAHLFSEVGQPERARALMGALNGQLAALRAEYGHMAETDLPAHADEPETLEGIRAARPDGPRRLSDGVPADYDRRLMGSILGRSAGCTLGAALEFSTMDEMENWARYCGEPFPPQDYFRKVKYPYRPRYIVGTLDHVGRGGFGFVPADDDTAYTMIGLLTMEAYGPGFTGADQIAHWRRNIPMDREGPRNWAVFWGERKLMHNLRDGVDPSVAGHRDNPNVQSIAAWTRADPWGYMAPGWPEKAAEFAFRDASTNHRRNGVYGSMFFAAAIAAAFVVDDPVECLRIGLSEIPHDCLLAEGVRWAMGQGDIATYREAGEAVRARYPSMFEGHAINNALFVVFGLGIGAGDFTRTIGETVAMGFDNDCTGATAGSILGATLGPEGIPGHWTEGFQGRMQAYLNDLPDFVRFDELGARFAAQAHRVHDHG